MRRGEGKEGIENLIEILSIASDTTADQIERDYEGAGYGQFKGDVADAVVAMLTPIRDRYLELRSDEAQLREHPHSRCRAGPGSVIGRRSPPSKQRMGFDVVRRVTVLAALHFTT